MISITKLFITVLRAFVTDTKIDGELKAQFTTDTLAKLFQLAKTHDVVQIVSEVLHQNDLLPQGEEITEKFHKGQMAALHRYMHIDYEQENLYQFFEQKGIPFIPLKGSVMRQYYPDPYMRTSCDVDILIPEEELDRATQLLIDELCYNLRKEAGYHDVSLLSPGGVHLELHFNLKEKRELLDKQLVKVWDYSMDTEYGAYYKLQTPEFFVFHHMAHMVNHFLRGGCGIRAFVDLYYIEKDMQFDREKLAELLRESGIEAFYNSAVQCVAAWFGQEAPSEVTELMEDFVLKGGVYGTRENRVSLERNKKGGKLGYYLSRVFIPYDSLKYKYPVLQKWKILLPFIWIGRLFGLLSPKKRKRAQKDMEMQKSITVTAEEATDKMLKLLEI